jgi:hypothetical protein
MLGELMDTGLLALVAMASVLCNANEYHHVNLGPEAFVIKTKGWYMDNSFRKNAALAGINASYEYLQPSTFYVGADWKYCVGSMNVQQAKPFLPRQYRATRDFEMAFRALEGRVGYNFLVYRDFMFTPYMGFGTRAFRARANDTGSPIRMGMSCVYMTQGLRTEYILSDRMRMGVCLKSYATMTGESKSNAYYNYLNPMNSGIEISFPFSLRCNGASESYVFKVEPYFRKDNINNAEVTMGATLKLSCDF